MTALSPLNTAQYAAGLRTSVAAAARHRLAVTGEEQRIAVMALDFLLLEYAVALDRLGKPWRRGE